MLSLSLRDKHSRNPVRDWLIAYHPVIMEVVKKLYITHLGIQGVGPERIRAVFLRKQDGEPISFKYALLRGVTVEELDTFDRQIDTDALTLIIDWKPLADTARDFEVRTLRPAGVV